MVDFPSAAGLNGRISARATDRSVILLVDDCQEEILLARQALELAQVRNPLFAVCGGEEAVLYLEGFGPFANRAEFPLPSLVLLDLNMPKIDGFRVLKWVRSHAQFKALPVVILTGSSDEDEVTKAYTLGANSFLVKPTDFSVFCEMMRNTASFWLHHSLSPELKRRPRGGRPKE